MLNHKREIDLGGQWRFRLDPEGLGEHYPQHLDSTFRFDARWMRFSYDDTAWSTINVPSCWQVEGYDYNGIAWYRTEFADPPVGADQTVEGADDTRTWLTFDGVDYFADVWLNEHYLGSHEEYFATFQHEITSLLRPEQNLLVVRVDSPNDICAKESQQWQLKTLIKGALQRWDVNNPQVNPGGIWNDVKLTRTGPGAITGLTIQTSLSRLPSRPGSDETVPATAAFEVEVAGFPSSVRESEAQLRVTVSPLGFEGQHAEVVVPIRTLPQKCTWPVTIDLEQAHLWYTWDIGTPHLYSVTVSLELGGSVSDEVSQRFGFREIERKQGWETLLNGFRIYQRGANYLSDQLLSTMTRERYEKDVDLLREANLNTVHPFCVVEEQTFYDVCDEVGILVYQDFPMWLEMDTSSDLVRRATSQMRELVKQFGHHPSIFVWNCGSQPSVANFEKLGSALAYTARELDPTRLVQQSNAIVDYMGVTRRDPVGEFGWGKHTIQDFKERYDWRIDTHQYYGWYYNKKLEDLVTIPVEHLELITEYGAQALPSREMLEKSIPKDALFPPVWPEYTIRCFQREVQFQFIDEPTSLEQFIHDSQSYQARFLQHHTEYYRRLKFNPCNGSHMFCFNDCWAAITWSVVDYDRERKPGFFALQRAMAPVQALLEPTDELRIDKETEIIVWVVNDLPRDFYDMTLTWKLANDVDGTIVDSGELECSADINSLKQAGNFTWTPKESGVFNVALQLSQEGKVVAQNQYRWTVGAEPEPRVE